MIFLGDFLGQLLAELSIARTHADLEAVRIAELYANHDILKHFPIPRIRVKDVDLEIPFVITKTEAPPTKDSSPRGGVSPEILKDRFARLLDDHLSQLPFSLPEKDHRDLMAVLNDTCARMVKPDYIQVDTNQIASKYIAATRKFFARRKYDIDPAVLRNMLDMLAKAAKADFIKARIDIPRIIIGATLSEIREAPSEAVVKISMRLSEEGLVWTHISSQNGEDGEEDDRLIPE